MSSNANSGYGQANYGNTDSGDSFFDKVICNAPIDKANSWLIVFFSISTVFQKVDIERQIASYDGKIGRIGNLRAELSNSVELNDPRRDEVTRLTADMRKQAETIKNSIQDWSRQNRNPDLRPQARSSTSLLYIPAYLIRSKIRLSSSRRNLGQPLRGFRLRK